MVEKDAAQVVSAETLAAINLPLRNVAMAQDRPEAGTEARWPGLAAVVAEAWENARTGGYEAAMYGKTPWEIAGEMMAYDATIEQFFVDPAKGWRDQMEQTDDALRLAIAVYIAGYSVINHG